MNKEQKAAVIEEVAAAIKESEAVFAVDYRGISVPQAAELREKLTEAGARFRVVKNTLTERAADQAGADTLKELLEGPTAFTFVRRRRRGAGREGARPVQARARRTRLQGRRHERRGAQVEQLGELSRLPARDVLHGQLVGDGGLADHRPRPRPERPDRRAGDPARADRGAGAPARGRCPCRGGRGGGGPKRKRPPPRSRRRGTPAAEETLAAEETSSEEPAAEAEPAEEQAETEAPSEGEEQEEG